MRSLLKPLASLRFTVVLLAFAMLLIFVGTIAQTKLGVWQAVESYFRAPIAWVDPGIFYRDVEGTSALRIPIPGGLLISALMIVNLLSAHLMRFKATRKRIGVLTLHAGLIVLLAGEFVTGFMADEGMMSIDEGSSSSYLEDVRSVELAVVDPSGPDTDRVVTVPGVQLARAAAGDQTIADDRLPFDVRIVQWMPNAALFVAQGATLADRGIGLEARAEARDNSTGVDVSSTDTPTAYIELLHEGESLGTWLVSSALTEVQRVEVDGVGYGLALRFRRTYLPFTLELNDFRHDTFVGTSIAKNFSSDIRLTDPRRETDRDVRIWMNNPLRYEGLTFYQASYKPDGSGTVLQAVRNPGWLLPYAACVLVSAGMTWHFMQSLVGFLRRRVKHGPVTAGEPVYKKARAWPWLVGALGVLLAVSAVFRSQPESAYDLDAFGEIPVSSGGRVKPFDTAARSMLMLAGGRQQVKTDEGTITAAEFMLSLIADSSRVVDHPVVRVDHPDLLALLGLTPEDGGRITLRQLEPGWAAAAEQAQRASTVPARTRDGFQKAVLELHHRVNSILAHAQLHQPYVIPPLESGAPWRPYHEAVFESSGPGDGHPSLAYLADMMTAASSEDAPAFNAAVAEYTGFLDENLPDVMRRSRLEVLFNRASMFSGATAVYLLAFLGVCASFVARSRTGSPGLAGHLRSGSFALLVAAVLVHTVAIAARIYLQDRPPVTNLYSSAIFVGWAAALAGLFLERLFPLGVSILGSATIGAGTLIIAHNLGNDGDTMEMMQAVLDSNFWLATHVITITLGYSATFLAGALACVYLLGRLFTNAVTPEREQALIRMTYGVVCFAMLLSFVGTVLGGIWADQSWGRFWGWDPKENGAALVVLINAIILHARWGGLVRARGIAVLAVGGNIVTAWSWFGTNMLGVGLHAYGFMDSAVMWFGVFVVSQLVLMGAAVFLTPKSCPQPVE